MNHDQVHLLDARCARSRHPDFDIAFRKHIRHSSPVTAGKGDDLHTALVCGGNGSNHVLRIARGRDPEQYVLGLTQCPDLLGENLLVGIVVAD